VLTITVTRFARLGGAGMLADRCSGLPPFALSERWHTSCYEKLCKLDWVAGFGVISHGVKIGVQVSDASLIPILRDRLPSHAKPYAGDEFDTVISVILGGREAGSRVRRFHLVYENHSEVGRSHEFDEALDRFDASFALVVATLSPRLIFVHGGAVAWQGRAIVIPGQSLSGKSTLVMELVRAGATYLSDEFAVFDSEGHVHPYPKPISMRKTPQSKQVDVPVASIGGVEGREPVPLGLVIVTSYVKGGRWRPKPVSSGEGILWLLSNTPAARLTPERALRVLSGAAPAANFIKSTRGEATDVAPFILHRREESMRQSWLSHSTEPGPLKEAHRP